MSFTDINYYLFLIMTAIIVMITAKPYRWTILLLFSLIFYYSWSAGLLAILLVVSTATWAAAILIDKGYYTKFSYAFYTIFLLTLFISLKNSHYFPGSLDQLLQGSTHLDVGFFAIGVSFYCLQAYSYVADVKNKVCTVEKNPLKILSYLSFFPQLLAGPIEKFRQLSSQIKNPEEVTLPILYSGIYLIIIGLFRKVVIGDNLSLLTTPIFTPTYPQDGLTYIIGSYLFWIQIYFDFSGYTLIALGSGKCLGITLTNNFRKPLSAKDIGDYWRRWHITFYQWIRSYLFTPLISIQSGRNHLFAIILITFLVSGLWHGISTRYALWGFYNFICFSIYHFLKQLKLGDGLFSRLSAKVYLFFSIGLSWIFFNAKSITHLSDMMSSRFINSTSRVSYILGEFNTREYLLTCIILGVVIYEFLPLPNIQLSNKYSKFIIIVLSIFTLFLFSTSTDPFIYFAF